VKRLRRLVFGSGGKSASARDSSARVVVFDFDGTIADTMSIAVEIYNDLAQDFGMLPITPPEMESARGMSARQIVEHYKVPTSKLPLIASKGLKALRQRMPEVQPCPEVPSLLRELEGLGCVLGILTSNSEDNVRVFLEGHGLPEFSFIRCSSRIFGKASELQSLLKTNRWTADQLLFIGDEVRDIEACQSAGIRCVAVTWGYNTRQALVSASPDFLIDHPGELIPLLQASS